MGRMSLKGVVLALCVIVGCAPLRPFYLGHGTSHDGRQWHTCANGIECLEGYACTKDGCEWCGDDDGIETRCTNALDSNPNGY